MRDHVGFVGCAVQFLSQTQPDGAMPPAVDAADRARAGIVAQIAIVDQNQSRTAIGHLAAIEPAQPAFGDRVGGIVIGDRVGDRPRPGLCVGVAPRVGEVQLGDGTQMVVVQAVAPVVFVGDFVEHRRPQVASTGPLVSGPGGGAEMLGGDLAGHGFLQLDTQHQRGVVGTRPQIGHRGQCCHTAGGARGFMPRSRGVPEAVADRGRHGSEVALAGEHLAEGVGDVDDPDAGRVHTGRSEGAFDDFGGQRRVVAILLAEVAGEITLVAAENPDTCGAIHKPHATPGWRPLGRIRWPIFTAQKWRTRRLSG